MILNESKNYIFRKLIKLIANFQMTIEMTYLEFNTLISHNVNN